MRRILLLAAVALAACNPASNTATENTTTATETTTAVAACNAITPDTTKAKMPAQLPPAAAAALGDALRGGPLNPGTYDLSSAVMQGDTPQWNAARAVAVEVTDTDAGAVVNYAEANGADTTRWTANFSEGPPATLAFTCGRTGQAPIEYASTATELRLSLPSETGTGTTYMTFARRS